MWREGELYRSKNGLTSPKKHKFGIYSDKDMGREETKQDNVSGILQKVDTMKLNDKEDNKFEVERETCLTQGDKLNQIKAARRQDRPTVANTYVSLNFSPFLMTVPVLDERSNS